MFSSCGPTFWGSGLQRRHTAFSRWCRRLWPFGKRSRRETQRDFGRAAPGQATTSTTRNIAQELNDESLNSVPHQDGQTPQGNGAANPGLRGESELRSQQHKTSMVPSARARRLDSLIASLVPAYLGSDLTFVSAFLGTYKTFTTTQRVLETLCARYGCVLPTSEGDGGPVDQMKGAIYSILGIWLDQHHEDFLQPPEFPCLSLLQAYVQVNFPGSSLEHQIQLLFAELKDLELPESDTDGPDEDQGTTQEVTPSTSVVPSPEAAAYGGWASLEEEEAEREITPHAMSGGSAFPEGVGAEWEDSLHAIPGMSGGSASSEGGNFQQIACLGSSEP
uniref:N-terminal Ras-GEF domain-containing protein n=1 Tax=Rousettus aegyptiacus TaxID=9407 RepID=A0A7J8H0T1_ROUAE|nr:hypothetical protein HJG63_011211 [Rousettus aegyptiacus]